MSVCPLTGKPCDFRKVYHITDVEPDGYKEYSLCNQCGPPFLKGESPESSKELENKLKAEALLAFLKYLFQPVAKLPLTAEPTKPPGKAGCPQCGATLEQIAESGRLGCGHCYEWYKAEILPILVNSQGATAHAGKRPKSPQPEPKAVPLADRIARLEEKLAELVKAERYEDAAKVRDVIKEMKAG